MTIRTINDAKNPVYADPTGYRIDLEVDFDELDEIYVPFTALKRSDSTKDYEYSHELFDRAINGEFGEVADYIPPVNETGEHALERLRAIRNRLLSETDYIESPTKWATLTEQEKNDWSVYRNALRDLPSTVTEPVFRCVQTVEGSDYSESYVADNFSFPVKP
jgi:hypothetical protein